MDRRLPDGMSLSPAEEDDAEYISHCVRESVLVSVPEEQRALSDLWIDAILSISMKEICERRMDDEVYVLWNGDERAGMLWIGASNDQFTCDPTGYLLGIYVEPALRRRGIGSGLLSAAEDICRERGYITLTLNVGAPNETARSFYRHHGFVTQTYVEQKLLR